MSIKWMGDVKFCPQTETTVNVALPNPFIIMPPTKTQEDIGIVSKEARDQETDLPYWELSETRRVACPTRSINCYQLPLNLDLHTQYKPLKAVRRERFAYVWHATSKTYLCSALTAFIILRDIRRVTQGSKDFQVDFVLVMVPEDLSDTASQGLLQRWKYEGGVVRNFTSLKKGIKSSYYRGTYQRFHAFKLVEYDRIVIMDADGFPLKNLDHLFQVILPSNTSLAAPQGYWFNRNGLSQGEPGLCPNTELVVITSVMLVVDPSLELFSRVERHFGSLKFGTTQQNYDMDILNKEFSCNDNIFILPKHYGTLDSEYNPDQKLYQKNKLCQSFGHVQYLHFSANGKPWTRGSNGNHYYLASYRFEVHAVLMKWFPVSLVCTV
eukprot:maker-scaffold160_size295910-snap-gene-1.41 protein:Tk01240 transcript:maker-scaffold160_size295910-snap-gene-1.41-mRNA-1 annotation:"hypothetical protein DFA_05069"